MRSQCLKRDFWYIHAVKLNKKHNRLGGKDDTFQTVCYPVRLSNRFVSVVQAVELCHNVPHMGPIRTQRLVAIVRMVPYHRTHPLELLHKNWLCLLEPGSVTNLTDIHRILPYLSAVSNRRYTAVVLLTGSKTTYSRNYYNK